MAVIVVGISDCKVSNKLGDVLVTHALGSCIAVAVYDPAAHVAGLLHLMLPDSSLDPHQAQQKRFMFADTGIPALVTAVCAQGADKRRLSTRLVGGAQVIDMDGFFSIGKRNYLASRKALCTAGMAVHSEAVGGKTSRTVRLDVKTGELWWQTSGGKPQSLPTAF